MQLSWFPFILYDTDWMGREIYHGDPKGTNAQISAFDEGVRVGSFGLLLNSVRFSSLISSIIARRCVFCPTLCQ
jgi:solute carrier family 45, member 1/2/4